MSEAEPELHSADFWDERYSGAERIWSGHVNQRLVEQVEHLPPGDALDIGCGEGGDAIWLAQRGWTVRAVDVSSVVVDKARAHATEVLDADVATRITWAPADIRSWQPAADSVDLVSLQFLHLPHPLLVEVAARLARAVRTGGALLVVNHDPLDLHTTMGRPHRPGFFQTADETAAALDGAAWHVDVAAAFPRPFTDPNGDPVVIHDTVVRATRR